MSSVSSSMLLFLLFILGSHAAPLDDKCGGCRLELIQDTPLGLDPRFVSPREYRNTYETLKWLLDEAKSTVNILTASSSLRALEDKEDYREEYNERGDDIFTSLKEKGRKVEIKIADNAKLVPAWKSVDARNLSALGSIERREIDVATGIVQHAKMVVVDGKHTLITSANLDHLSLNLKSELGILVSNCPCFAEDSLQIFNNIWRFKSDDSIPAKYNQSNPLQIGGAEIYTSMSVDLFREPGRADDMIEMIRFVREAKEFIYISVMDFWPTPDYSIGDDGANMTIFLEELTSAVDRGVTVKVLVSAAYPKRRKNPKRFLKELSQKKYDVKVLNYPEHDVMKHRRLHAKYMLTEKEGMISTSNFTPDYFFHDTGLAVVIKEDKKKILAEMEEMFNWHWSSIYAERVEDK